MSRSATSEGKIVLFLQRAIQRWNVHLVPRKTLLKKSKLICTGDLHLFETLFVIGWENN